MISALRNPWNVLPALGVLLIALYPLFSDDLYYQNMIMLSMVFAIGAVGLNIITGYAGYVSLGQGAFLGLGAYTAGILATDVGGNPFVWVPAAGLVAGGLAALLGVVAMRARGTSFVILTIAFLFLVQITATRTGLSTTRSWGCSQRRFCSRGGSGATSSAWG